MVYLVMMYDKHYQQQQPKFQKKQQQQQQSDLKKYRKHEQIEKESKEEDFLNILTTNNGTRTNTLKYLTNNTTTTANTKDVNSCCTYLTLKKQRCNSRCFSKVNDIAGNLYLWLVLVVFMLILCGNTAISQQRNINNNVRQNNSNNNNNNNNNSSSNNKLLQVSTQTQTPTPTPISLLAYTNNNNNNNGDAIKDGGSSGGGFTGSVGIIVADEVEKQQQHFDDFLLNTNLLAKINTTTKTTITTSSSSTSSSSSSSSLSSITSSASKNSPTLSTSKITNEDTTANTSSLQLQSNNNETLLNDGESIIASSNKSNNNDNNNNDNNNSSEDLLNSAEILNESEDEYEHSSTVSSTTYRPNRSSVAPVLTSAQERERRLMNVLAARRSALQRPGFRNRVATTGRTAAAVETTSKSPTDPRSICIRNCTKNFTRRTTASCMRQCANFSRVSSGSAGMVVVKDSSKSGSGTAQAGEKDTNEILFTDESSHGLLVIAKEQNDTLNHIPDENKGATANKLRGRRKHHIQMNTVTMATTSIEDDEIQPYLYFGQKLPPLKPNALTITSVSDEHPKILEVAVADVVPSSTTPVSLTTSSTLSAVERSRARFKYNMRNGVSFNRRYSTISRSTTPEIPTEPRTTTLRIVAEVVKDPKVKLAPDSFEKLKETSTHKPFAQVLRDEAVLPSSTPLIITVLGDDEMITSTPPVEANSQVKSVQVKTAITKEPITNNQPITTTSSSTTEQPITSTAASTTTTTEASTSTTASTTTTGSTTINVQQQQTAKTILNTTSTTTSTFSPPAFTFTDSITKKPIISEEDTELLRQLGPSLTEPINTDDKTNLIIFVNRTTDTYRPHHYHFINATTNKPSQQTPQHAATTDSSTTILHTTVLTSIRSTVNSGTKDIHYPTTTSSPTASSQKGPVLNAASSTTLQPTITGEISSTVVTDDQEISLEMQRMNIVTLVLAGIGIVPLIAIILYLLRNYLLKRPIKDDEDFDVCITDQQPISPVKKIDAKYQTEHEDEDEVDHHKKPPQRQHSLHSKLVSAPLVRDNNHNLALNQQQRFDDKSSLASDQEFERSNIRLKSLLGEGNFGQVWKAEADDLSGHFGATRIVAVKTIKACSTQLSLKDEANIMRKLGSHQNVVTLLGACVDSEPHMLIMEYAMRGRLLSLLRAARNATNILPASVPGGRSLTPLSPRTLAGFCLDIAHGMEYIAEKRIVHRDLAARNVLLDHNGVCKICDFGMSIDLDAERKRKELEKNCANEIMRSNFNKFKFDFGGKFIMHHWTHQTPTKDCNEKKSHGQDTVGKRPALPIRWMAPEALQFNYFSTETDIWAFGIVLWEIATLGSTPYSQIAGREVIRRVPQGLRPDLPKEGRHEFYNLMSRCWHKDPQMRPSFGQCRLEISRSLHKWVDDDAASDYMDVSGFSEDLEQGMVYFNHRISEFECEI